MSSVSMDAAVAVLSEYQDRLDRARSEGPARYDQVFSNPPPGVGLHEIDKDRVIRRVNAVEPELLGYRAEDLVGRAVHDFIVMSEASQRAIEKKLSGEAALKPFVRTFRKSDGSAVAMALVDRILKDGRGAVIGIRTALMPIVG